MARTTRFTTKKEQGFIWIPPDVGEPIKKIEIVSDGVTHDISADIVDISVKSSITEAVSNFSLTLSNHGTFVGKYTNVFTEGDDIQIWFGYGSTYYKKFRGQIEKQDYSYKKAHTIKLSGRDYGNELLKKHANATYENMDPADIITDAQTGLMPVYISGMTTNNVADVGTTMTGITFKNQKVFNAIKQLAKASNFHFFIDSDKDLNFFEKNSKQSTTVAAVAGVNVSGINIGKNIKEVKNKIIVYGKNLTGDIMYLGTKEDTTSQALYNGVSEDIITDTSLESADELAERGDAELLVKKTPSQNGSVTIPGAPTLKQGEQIRMSSPHEKINGWFLPLTISHDFKAKSYTTTLTIERPTDSMITEIKQRELAESQLTNLSNPNDMEDSYVVTFENSDLVDSFGNTEISGNVLMLKQGKDDGTMKTIIKFLSYSPSYCELRFNGQHLASSIFTVTFDNEVNYQRLSSKNKEGVQNTGTDMIIKARLIRTSTNTQPNIESVEVLIKR